MADKRIIRFNINGNGAHPDSIGMGELGNLLNHLEAAIKASIPPVERIEHSGTREPLASLVGLTDGNSSDMAMSVIDYALPALSEITLAISTGNFSEMAVSSQEEMASIYDWIARRRFEFEIEPDEEVNIHHAVISRKRPVPSPSASAATIDGTTTAYGYLIQAGGKKPRAALLFPNDDKVVITADENVTKELGSRLYEQVGIEGVATWRVRDLGRQRRIPARPGARN
jgi:hypothetical protein